METNKNHSPMRKVLFTLLVGSSLGCSTSDSKPNTGPYQPKMTFVCTKSPDVPNSLVAIGFYEDQTYPDRSYKTMVWPITYTDNLHEGDRIRLFRHTTKKQRNLYVVQTGSEKYILPGSIFAVAVSQ